MNLELKEMTPDQRLTSFEKEVHSAIFAKCKEHFDPSFASCDKAMEAVIQAYVEGIKDIMREKKIALKFSLTEDDLLSIEPLPGEVQ